ncbi:MAG: PQQ-binding-like beta-propeller repeat protein [Planctomycetes bacterium]|nr:PQQ-binding-like beta-propeller repeat protein [Planctomycetota bacterium]
MNPVCRAVAFTLLFAAVPALAQSPAPESANLRGDSAQTSKRLTEADQKRINNQPNDALDAVQRILDEAGDDLVAVDGKHNRFAVDGKQYRTARYLAQQILTRLPDEAFKGHQDRLEGPAKKLLDVAKKTRDPAPLWQLIDRYFVSRPADEGLFLLGELLFEEGEFRTAEQVWRRLLPDAGAEIVYPNSKTDPAAVRARIILAAIFAGETSRAQIALAAFKSQHLGAKGQLAGKVGAYADILQVFLDAPPKIPQAANRGTDWPTFGGSPERSGRLGVRFPSYWPTGKPSWFDRFEMMPRPDEAPRVPPKRPPLGHPVIANGRVFVTDGTRLLGYELMTGKPLSVPARFADLPTAEPMKPLPPDACPSLTAVGDRVYMRVGVPLMRSPEPTRFGKGAEESAIICLGPGKDPGEMRELWRVHPPGDDKTPIIWEGAPLVAGRRMWAAHARFEGGRVVHGIECYDPADATTQPRASAWSTDVCDSPQQSGDPRTRQELLTLAGRHVIFCSNSGAVVALDAATGKRSWGFRYARSRKGDANRSPDPSPAVFSCGRVFLAPADADRVYALDPETGLVLWESGPTEGAQILGVAAGKLIVSVTGPVRGLRGLSVVNGSHRDPDGWVIHDGGGLLSYGRGFVTDEVVVWPTRNGLCFIRPQTGDLLGPPFLNHLGGELSRYFGNLAYANGVLIAVTPTQIWAYVSDGKRFGEVSERAKFDTLIEKAEIALSNGEPAIARESLLAATRSDFPKPLRAWAVARLLLLTPLTDDEAKLPAELRTAITPELRDEWLLPPEGVPVTLGTLLLRRTGREPPPRVLLSSPCPPRDRELPEAPFLEPDAAITRTARLPPGSIPLRWLPGMAGVPKRLYSTTSDRLFGVGLADGDNSRHDVIDQFTHAADLHEGFVVAGPLAVAVYASDRVPVWIFRVPTTEPLPAMPGQFRLASVNLPPPALSSFRLSGSWLLARLGERHLIALDLKYRRVAWVLGTNGMLGFRPFAFPDATEFGAAFSATGRFILAQLSDGRRWFVRVETGKILDVPGFDQPSAKVFWSLPPAEVEANRLVVSDGPGLVRLLNLTTGRVRWTHQEERDASLAGSPPQVRAWGLNILLAVQRNHGVELDRLNAPDGLSAWKGDTAFLDADSVNLADADADAERVYVPAGKTLAAFALKDGKLAWEVELPRRRFHASLSQMCSRELCVHSATTRNCCDSPVWWVGCMMRGSRGRCRC